MMKISLKLFYQYMVIFQNFSPTLSHLHPLQVKNCGSNSQLVVDKDYNGKFRLERVKLLHFITCSSPVHRSHLVPDHLRACLW